MHRLLACLAAAVCAVAITACGDDKAPVAQEGAAVLPVDAQGSATPHLTLAETQSILESGKLALVREAMSGRAPASTEVSPRPVSSRRLEEQSGQEFDVLIFRTPQQARAAWPSIQDTHVIRSGGSAMRVANVVALFPDSAADDVVQAAKRRLRAVATACAGRGGDEELRRACFGEPGGVPPAGNGTAADDLAPIGTALTVGGIRYDVTVARQLNPHILPDRQYLDGRRPDGDSLFFGVFLRACDVGGGPTRTTSRLALLDAFGHRTSPVPLAGDNPFAYRPTLLDAKACLPHVDSVADRGADGVLVVFEIPRSRLEQRPLGLEVTAPDGRGREVVALDV